MKFNTAYAEVNSELLLKKLIIVIPFLENEINNAKLKLEKYQDEKIAKYNNLSWFSKFFCVNPKTVKSKKYFRDMGFIEFLEKNLEDYKKIETLASETEGVYISALTLENINFLLEKKKSGDFN